MQIDKGIPLQTQERENYFKISSQMSQAEGLSKLTEYLKQTKRQAEAAVDHLNKEIIRLNEENSSLKRILHKVSQEREEYLTTVEELKIKNTNKYKLKERDDWKNLVDQVQQDRTRLQQENEVLMHQLESSAAEMKNLQLHIESLETELSQKESAEESVELTLPSKSPTKSPRTPSKKIPTPLSSPNKSVRQRSFSFRADTKIEEEEQIPPVITEIPPETIIEQGNLDIDTIIAQLKQQLQRTYDQVRYIAITLKLLIHCGLIDCFMF